MKFKASFIPYVIFQCGFRLSVALIEPDADTLSAVGRAAFTAIDSASTDFYSEADAPPSFVSTLTVLEETFGLESGSTKLDGRSGKAASLDLKHPILPGDGVGNGLLWSVGGGHGAPESDGELSDLSVEAVKVRPFTGKYMHISCSLLTFMSSKLLRPLPELDARSPSRSANRCF